LAKLMNLLNSMSLGFSRDKEYFHSLSYVVPGVEWRFVGHVPQFVICYL